MSGPGDGLASGEVSVAEFLYELWDAGWDDGPLGNYQVLRHEIVKKTPQRIYFTMNGRSCHVDRRRIEAEGEVYHGRTMRRLHLEPPEVSARPGPVSLSELRRVMADAHPDRGGTEEGFIAARRRYERARAESGAAVPEGVSGRG